MHSPRNVLFSTLVVAPDQYELSGGEDGDTRAPSLNFLMSTAAEAAPLLAGSVEVAAARGAILDEKDVPGNGWHGSMEAGVATSSRRIASLISLSSFANEDVPFVSSIGTAQRELASCTGWADQDPSSFFSSTS